MPGNTPNGLPYPLGTEPISQGDDAILALATALDKRVPYRMAGGSLPFGAIANGASGNVTVPYPAGLFTVPPILLVLSALNRLNPAVTANSAVQATINLANFSGANAGASSFLWLAIQLPV